jgi:hypothetical protein
MTIGQAYTVTTHNGGRVTGRLTETHPGLIILTTQDGHAVHIDTLNIKGVAA